MLRDPLMRHRIVRALRLAAACLVPTDAQAQSREVTFAYQDMLVPLRTVIESGELERATGYRITWRQFGGGGDVIRAMASGDVQIVEAGSSPLPAPGTHGQATSLFW